MGGPSRDKAKKICPIVGPGQRNKPKMCKMPFPNPLKNRVGSSPIFGPEFSVQNRVRPSLINSNAVFILLKVRKENLLSY